MKKEEIALDTDLNHTTKGPAPGIPKNFRQQADIEAFYRFVYDNDLREEAHEILNTKRAQKELLKTAKNRVKH